MSDTEQASGPSELELLKNRARLLGVEFSNNIGLETLRERVNAHLKEIGADEPLVPQPNPLDDQIDQEDLSDLENVEQPDLPEDFDSDIEEVETPTETVSEPAPLKAEAPVTEKIKAPEIKPQRDVNLTPSTALGSAVATKKGKVLSPRQQMYNEQMKLIRVRIHNMDPKKSALQGEILTVANRVLGNVKIFVPFGEATEDGWHIPYIIYKELNRRKFLSITTTKDKQTKQLKVTKKWMKEFALDILPPLTEAELSRLATAQLAAGTIDNSAEDML